MHEAIIVAKRASGFGNEAQSPVEFVGAEIAGQRIDHDGGHCRVGKAYLEGSSHHRLAVAFTEIFCRPDPDVDSP